MNEYEEALDLILSSALRDAARAIKYKDAIYVVPAVHNMNVGLQDYVWNLRGRP
jgi:hypothetical protein